MSPYNATNIESEHVDAEKVSSNWSDGKFINPVPTEQPSVIKALVKWLRGTDNTVPDSPIPTLFQITSVGVIFDWKSWRAFVAYLEKEVPRQNTPVVSYGNKEMKRLIRE